MSRILLVVAACLGMLPTPVLGHAQGEDYVFFNFRQSSIDGLFEVHFDELRDKLGLAVEEGESALASVRATASQVQAYLRANFSVGSLGGEPFDLQFTHQEVVVLPQGTFAQYHFRSDTGPLPDQLAISHSMFYEGDRLHRGLVMIEYNAKTDTTYPGEYTALVFSPSNSEQTLDLTDVPSLISPRAMVAQGVLHIWIGIDHILFLLALMLPTVLFLDRGEWRPVDGFRSALWNLLKIVTVFTIAHSITLLLAALDLVRLPSRLVESVIALSIVLVALNNIAGKVREGSLWIILVLGLFHGLGFASVMGHLPFRMVDLLRSVVGFNIGVELGQIAIVALIFPIMFALRRTRIYEPVVLKGGLGGADPDLCLVVRSACIRHRLTSASPIGSDTDEQRSCPGPGQHREHDPRLHSRGARHRGRAQRRRREPADERHRRLGRHRASHRPSGGTALGLGTAGRPGARQLPHHARDGRLSRSARARTALRAAPCHEALSSRGTDTAQEIAPDSEARDRRASSRSSTRRSILPLVVRPRLARTSTRAGTA